MLYLELQLTTSWRGMGGIYMAAGEQVLFCVSVVGIIGMIEERFVKEQHCGLLWGCL